MMIAYVNILVLVRKILRTERHLTAVPSAPRGFDGNGSSVHMSLLNGKQVYPRPNNALTLQRSASAKSQDYAYRAPSSKKSSMESRELKAIRTLTAIVFAFLISWLPFFVVALIRPFYPGVPKWISGLTYWAGLSNSAINPILYSVFNADFRRPFAELLRCRCWSLRKTMRAESYESQFGDTTRASFRSRTSPKTDRNIHNEAIFFKTRSDSTVQENEL
ncbi:hypothetical protein RvY_12885-2 [Ramazzottius varieornatus]|uniref:G-protein coupled receptors family 1 profile domain-containing protein n=1 Tax=Ramazzottius varieornatus TaxID=947166 RepID=A0A1D1VL06_RAMVA|nr:hypothetical protein RvY_12885-2 [Ramazzottius varieornatus]